LVRGTAILLPLRRRPAGAPDRVVFSPALALSRGPAARYSTAPGEWLSRIWTKSH